MENRRDKDTQEGKVIAYAFSPLSGEAKMLVDSGEELFLFQENYYVSDVDATTYLTQDAEEITRFLRFVFSEVEMYKF